MKELSKHIEVLLLENDCVIVPGLGGFIAHYRPASRDEEGNFNPQTRSIGFNSRLVMNDGLLVQSYMQAYSTDFPDATRKIEKVVDAIKDEIYQKGEVTFGNIGTLSYNIKGEYEFSPASESFFTPSLYGLQPFRLPILQSEKAEETTDEKVVLMPQVEIKTEEDKEIAKVIPMKPIRWWHGVASAAAAVALFFVMSVPAENTYINAASLGGASLFEAIRSQSMVSTVKTDQDKKKSTSTSSDNSSDKTVEKNNANTLKPTTVKTEVVSEENSQDNSQTKSQDKSQDKSKDGDQDKTQDNKDKKSSDNKQQTNTSSDKESNKQSSTQSSSPTSTKKNNSTSSESNSVSSKKSTTTTSSSSSSTSSSSTLGKLFYVIVSSLTNSSDAEKEVTKLKNAGYTDAKVIESDGRYRVALTSCSSQSEAYNKIEKLKNEGSFEQAWVLNSDK